MISNEYDKVSVFFAIITLFLLRDNFRIKTFSLFILKRLMQFGLPLVPAAVSIYFLQYVDRYMIVNMLGLESLGLYSVGIRISTVIMLVFSGFQMAWGPFIFANYKNPAIHLILTKTFVTLMISTLLLTVSFTLFSPELLFLIANPVYENAYIYVPYLMFTSFLFLIRKFNAQ